VLMRALIIASIIALLPLFADAQDRAPTRAGFWFNGGVGFGSASRDGGDGRESGLALAMSAGGTLSPTVLFGASIDAWTKSEGGSLTVATLLGRLRFYSSATSRFFLTAGFGIGRVTAEVTDIGSRSETGTGWLVGLGYDAWAGPKVSFTPFLNGFITTTDPNFNVVQLGLSVTVN
jgi:hypothetical protein